MLDGRDFDEWWEREKLRAGRDPGREAEHWAHLGFMAAAVFMTRAIRAQREAQKQREPVLLRKRA